MYKNLNKVFNINIYKSKLFYFLFLKNIKNLKFRHEKITVFHLKKKLLNKLKNHKRKRKIFFFMLKKNTNTFFVFNKPKSKLVKQKKRK